jgi:hypothetical protein
MPGPLPRNPWISSRSSGHCTTEIQYFTVLIGLLHGSIDYRDKIFNYRTFLPSNKVEEAQNRIRMTGFLGPGVS